MAGAEPHRVLRFECADAKDGIVVVYVFNLADADADANANANAPLHLEIIASEGETAFGTTVKSGQVLQFQDASYHGSDTEWESILKDTLLLDPSGPDLPTECMAKMRSDASSLTLVWQRQAGDTTQRLGTIELEAIEDPGEKFDLFWGCAAGARQTAQEHRRARELHAQLALVRDENEVLRRQLSTLIQAKEEHETELLHKFAELLNAKKRKIREQQRLLASAKLDPEKARELNGSITLPAPTPDASRALKRKAPSEREGASEDESSDGFEPVYGDGDDEDDEEEGRVSTPEPRGEATTDEDEGVHMPPPPPEAKKAAIKRTLGNKTMTLDQPRQTSADKANIKVADKTTTKVAATREKQTVDEGRDVLESPPPRRHLPFSRTTQAKPSAPASRTPAASQSQSHTRLTRSSSHEAASSRPVVASPAPSPVAAMAPSKDDGDDDGDNHDDDDRDDTDDDDEL